MRRAFDANWVVIRTESGRGVPRPEHLALVPVPGRGDLAQPLPPGKGTGGVPLAVPSRLPRSRANVCWTKASPFGYTAGVGYAVTKSATFLRWLKELRDKRARARIAIRIDRVQEGNFGDHKAVGGGVSELRILLVRVPSLLHDTRRDRGSSVVWRRQVKPAARHKTRPANGD